MTTVAVLGAGAGGLSCAVELTAAGHAVRLWNRGAKALPQDGVITHRGVLANGVDGPSTPLEGVNGPSTPSGARAARVQTATTDLGEALRGAEAVVVSLPALGHPGVFAGLAERRCDVPVVLNPGHTGGALHLRQVFKSTGVPLPPVAELSTLTYVARRGQDGGLHVTGRARQVRCAPLPGGQQAAETATELFSGAITASDVLATSLSNVNLVLHPPGAILGAAWAEATAGAFTFYVDAMTQGVGRVIDALDAERRLVAAAFGHDLPSLTQEMALIGTVPPELAEAGTARAISAGEANAALRGPDSLAHRYYREDFGYAVAPFIALAQLAGVAVPVASALLTVAGALLGDVPRLDAAGLGIDRTNRAGLLRMVRHDG